jgi:predicted nuclease of predicted toxin-antitoxin system
VKLLFDQNISHRVVLRLNDILPEAKHVKDFNLQFSSDFRIREFAKENGFTMVTFDVDFFDLAVLMGIPPKLIWLRLGNIGTSRLVEVIRSRENSIRNFIEDPELRDLICLEIQ